MNEIIELQNDIETLEFHKRHIIRELAELENRGLTHSEEFKRLEEQLRICNSNIRTIEREIVRLEEGRLEEAV